MFYFQPFIPLSLNLLVFIILLIVVVFVPARTAFTMEHSRLYISLYTVQVLTGLMALLSQIFSSFSSFFSLLTICLIPFGFILGWMFYYAPSVYNSYPYDSLRKILLSNNDMKFVAMDVISKKFIEVFTGDENEDAEEENNCCIFLGKFLSILLDIASFRSIFHRGFTSNELKLRVGDILMENIRKDNDTVSFESYNSISIKTEDEWIQEVTRKRRENLKTKIIKEFLSLFDYVFKNNNNNIIHISGNNFLSSNIFESFSFILLRDDYISGKLKYQIKTDGYYEFYGIPEIIEKSMKNTCEYLMGNVEESFNRMFNNNFKDYLLFLLYYPNSLNISLINNIILTIPIQFNKLFFGFPYPAILNSLLLFSQSISSNYEEFWKIHVDSLLYCYKLGIEMKECLNLILPFLRLKYYSLSSSTSLGNDIYEDKEEILFDCFKKPTVTKFSNQESIFIGITLDLLLVLSSLFKNDWRYCVLFATFINEKDFVVPLRNDNKYLKKVENIKIKKFLDSEDNDLWLLKRIEGKYDQTCFNDNTYFNFDCLKDYNEFFVGTFSKKERFLNKIIDIRKIMDFESNCSVFPDKDAFEYYDQEKKKREDGNHVDIQEGEKLREVNFLEESANEIFEEIEEEDMNKKDKFPLSLLGNNNDPFVITFLTLCLYSEVDIIREHALLALYSCLDYEKIKKENTSKSIGPSFIHLFCKKMDEWHILSALCYNIKNVINFKEMKNEYDFYELSYEILLLSVFDGIVEYVLNANILLSSNERRGTINYFCSKDIIEWIASFYNYKEEKEKVVRLLYILISCSEETVLSDLFNFDESSVLLLLLENDESEISNNMSVFSYVQIIENILSKKEVENTKEDTLKLLLSVFFLILYKCDTAYGSYVINIIIKKYNLFDNNLSQSGEGLKEEIFCCLNEERIQYLNCYLLFFISLSFSIYPPMKREGNLIVHDRDSGDETCIFDTEMNKGVYHISFKTGNKFDRFCIGLIDSSLGIPEGGKSISSSYKGISFYQHCIINKSNYKVKSFCTKYLLNKGDRVEMEVDLRSEDPKKRCMYFFIKDRWEEVYFCGLPSSVKFGITLYSKDSSIYFISLKKLSSPSEKISLRKEEHWFSNELFEEYKEFERKEREKNHVFLEEYFQLSSVFVLSSDSKRLKREGNTIVHCGDYGLESFIFDFEMKKGIFHFSFRIGNYPNDICVGLIDSFLGIPETGKNISSSNKGVMFYYVYGDWSHGRPDWRGDFFNKSNLLVKMYDNKYGLEETDRVEMEVDLRSEDPKKRCLYFFIKDRWEEVYFCGLPKVVKFGITLRYKDSSIEFVEFKELNTPSVNIEGEKEEYNWE